MSEEPEGEGSEVSSLPSVVGDAIGDLVTGIPAPIRNSVVSVLYSL